MNKTKELIRVLDDDYTKCYICKKYFLKEDLGLESEDIIADYLQQSKKNIVRTYPLHLICTGCENKILQRRF